MPKIHSLTTSSKRFLYEKFTVHEPSDERYQILVTITYKNFTENARSPSDTETHWWVFVETCDSLRMERRPSARPEYAD